MPLDLSRAFKPVAIAVATISDSRTPSTDKSGDLLVERLSGAGHRLVARQIIPDEVLPIKTQFSQWIDDPFIDVIISTGGTGVTGRDVTPEALMELGGKDIPGFGEYFRMLSAAKIGSSTIQSRALARVVKGKYIFCLPGSPGACRDGWDEILATQLDYRFRPCNFVELMPRLLES